MRHGRIEGFSWKRSGDFWGYNVVCIIIDANVADAVCSCTDDAKPVVDWLTTGNGKLVYGGKNAEELMKLSDVQRFIRSLFQAGRAVSVDGETLAQAERRINAKRVCRSNDCHVIALAVVSGARLLYSHDKALHADFKNEKLISNPRGSVYQKKSHAKLLRKASC